MKNRIIYMAALLLLAGCAADETYETKTDEPVPILLTAGTEAQSRASFPDTDAGNLPAGSEVAIHIRTVDNVTGVVYPRTVLTSDGTGRLTGGDAMYYPETGNVDVFALAPASLHDSEFDYSASKTLWISTDQRTREGYTASDFMIATARDVSKNAAPVPLTFYHMLSKLKVALVAGDAATGEKLQGATIEVCNVPYYLAFQHYDVYKATDWSDASQRAKTVEVGFGAYNKKDISIGNDISPDFSPDNVRYNDAIMIPQTFAAGQALLRVVLTDGTTLEWKPANDQLFESGKRYTYHVTVTDQRLSVSTTVAGWDDGELSADTEIMDDESNCYMVKPNGGPILIPISKANRITKYSGVNTNGLGGVTADNFTIELVWGDTPVGAGGVIRKMEARKHLGQTFIYVEPGIAGNAVICIKVGGVVKWSWHIWVTEPVTWATDTESGITWMDRNLGALGAVNQEDGRNGLLYQWGRKDAFPVIIKYESYPLPNREYFQRYYTQAGGDTPTDAAPEVHGNEYNNDLPDLVQYPFIRVDADNYGGSLHNIQGEGNIDTFTDDWGGKSGQKTVYDPCPPGWKVALHYSGNLDVLGLRGNNNGLWTKTDGGFIFDGINNGKSKLGLFFSDTNHNWTATNFSDGLSFSILWIGFEEYFALSVKAWTASSLGSLHNIRCIKE